jgi:hypothetical protein
LLTSWPVAGWPVETRRHKDQLSDKLLPPKLVSRRERRSNGRTCYEVISKKIAE